MRRPRKPTSRLASALLLSVVAVLVGWTLAHAQRGRWRGGEVEPNATYDGRFTFVRLRYAGGRRSGWSFDYPAMERNFMTILDELTTVGPHVDESNVLTMDDTALFRYPVAYLSEPGYWVPNEAEAAGLRAWLAKGGFLIVDDFYGRQWTNFERSMMYVLPDAHIVELDVSHPIFNTFFKIETLDGLSHPADDRAKAVYLGIFEDNDPTQRLSVIINYNNDIGDFMEWSGEGWYPINFTNDAYKLATNYVIYGLTR